MTRTFFERQLDSREFFCINYFDVLLAAVISALYDKTQTSDHTRFGKLSKDFPFHLTFVLCVW